MRKAPPKAPQQEAEAPKAASGAYLDDDIRQALAPVLARLERPITLRLYSDNSSYAEDDRKLITELASLCDKISAEVVEAPNEDLKHTIAILDAEGRDLGGASTVYLEAMNLIRLYWHCIMPRVRDRISGKRQKRELQLFPNRRTSILRYPLPALCARIW